MKGTAFSSSLFGLGGSLILGFLDLQAGQAQNRFYHDLEEWLSSETRLATSIGGAEGDGSVPAYIQALLEQTAESIDKLQRSLSSEDDRHATTIATTTPSKYMANITRPRSSHCSDGRNNAINST